jgi:putative nucleotidyltransferase with HDIG domain
MGGDEFCVLIDASETLLHRAASALHEEGESFVISSAFGAVTLPEEASEPSSALSLADQRLYAHKDQMSSARTSPHELLLRTLAEREPGLRAHVEGVARLAVTVGRELGMNGDEIAELRLAAELHDVGKLAIPDAVLRKAGDLSAGEWDLIRGHPDEGARIIERLGFPSDTVAAIRHHHERFDGTGYPEGLAGEEIPLGARIIHVADAWDSMLTVRTYRPALGEREALRELKRGIGTQFCPRCVQAIEEVLPALEASAPVALSAAS